MNIISTVTNTIKVLPAKAKFAIVKNAPVLCLGAGLVTIGAGVVLACKATRKADTVINETKEFIADAETKIGKECSDGSTYTQEDYEIDVKNEKIKRNVKVAKAFVLSICVLAVGMGLVCFGHGILAHRYTTTVTALNGLVASTQAYRAKVAEKIGEEAERELYYSEDIGVKQDLTYIWDENSPGASKNNTMNAGYLAKMYNYLYDRFDKVGHIFVWDILRELGIEETQLDVKDLRIAKEFGWRKGFTDDMSWGVIFEDFLERAGEGEFDNMEPVAVVLDFGSARNLLVSDKVWEPFGDVVCLT